jgi:hypothetical protein
MKNSLNFMTTCLKVVDTRRGRRRYAINRPYGFWEELVRFPPYLDIDGYLPQPPCETAAGLIAKSTDSTS